VNRLIWVLFGKLHSFHNIAVETQEPAPLTNDLTLLKIELPPRQAVPHGTASGAARRDKGDADPSAFAAHKDYSGRVCSPPARPRCWPAAAWYGMGLLTVGQYLVRPRRLCEGDSTTVAPKVSGYLARVLVGRKRGG